jgi:hypothetical protein
VTGSYTFTREQLIDAIANLRIEGVKTTGPTAGLVLADDLADAILAQVAARCEDCGAPSGAPCAAPPGERCIVEK